MSNPTRIYPTSRFRYLASSLVDSSQGAFVLGDLAATSFPNGEQKLEIVDIEAASGSHVVLIGSTDREDLFDLLLCASELSRVARKLEILVPFFRYSTQERKDPKRRGRIVAALRIAEIISSLPVATDGNRIWLVDPHTPTLASFFDSARIRVEEIGCESLLSQLVDQTIPGARSEKVICSVDRGRIDEVTRVADLLGCPTAFVDKERMSGTETRVRGGVQGSVEGKIAVMVDDMGRTLGSAAGAAKAYRDAGAREVWLVVTHPDFAPSAIALLQTQGIVLGLRATDSYPSYTLADGGFAQIHPIGPFLAEALLRRLRS